MTGELVKICFKSDWHIGTGAGLPGIADNLQIRDRDGFPFIPGRSLRGVMRDAHRELHKLDHIRQDIDMSPEYVWGTFKHEQQDSVSEAGIWQISNGEINPVLRQSIMVLPVNERKTILNEFTYTASRIALDENHRVKEHHLGFIEVGRKGLEFTFTVSRRDGRELSDGERRLLRLILLYVRHIGGTRRRGKGLAELYLEKDGSRTAMRAALKGGAHV